MQNESGVLVKIFNSIKKLIYNYSLLFMLALWLIVQLSLYLNYGFITEFEGAKYQLMANELISGAAINQELLFYSVYPIVISLFLKIGLGLKSMLIIQLIANAWASYRFYGISRMLFSEKWISIFTTSAFILTLQIQQWNFFLFTESLFVSGLIIYTYNILIFDYRNKINSILLALLFIFLSFLRPIGLLLFIPTLIYFYFNRNNIKSFASLIPLLLSIGLVFILNQLNNSTQLIYLIKESFSNSWVILGYNDLSIQFHQENTIIFSFKLLLNRIYYFFSMQRPYYSLGHNIMVSAFYLIYGLALFGIRRFYKNNLSFFIYSLLFILSISTLSLLLYLNWHGRFIVPILPFFIIFSGYGVEYLLEKRKAQL